ncbi:hypothetical protein Tco_1104042 [Tanacetum coccineum]
MIPGTDLHCFDVHNNGYFSHLSLSYVNGVILNMAVLNEKFAEYLEEKCGNYFQGLYYQVPNIELETALVRVSSDRELSYMFDVEETFGRLELYLDHLDMDLSEYLSQAIKTEMDVCVSKTIGPSKKEDGSSQHPQKTDKGKDATEGVEARTSTTDKGKEKVSQDATEGVEASTSTTDSEFDSDDDSEYDSNKSIDYLSPSKEELIELRNRMCHTPTMAKT